MKTKQFKAESKRLLDMMIHSIYTHKEIFLRELISNASDAMDKLYFRSLTDEKVGMNREDFAIDLKIDKDARTLTITDNGIGMTQEELERYVQNNALEGESFQEAWDRILNIHLDYGTWKTPNGSYFPNNLTGDWALVSRTADKNVWYVNPHNPSSNTLIWNGAHKETDGIPSWISGTYLILFGCCVFLAVVLLLATRNRNDRIWELLRCFAVLAASAAVSILLVTSGNLITTGYMASYKWPQMIICESVTLTLTALMWRKLYQTNKT